MPKAPFPPKSIFFAPLDGITLPFYRKIIMDTYPEWDYLPTNFLRIPRNTKLSIQKIKEHFGLGIYTDVNHFKKTYLQILCSQSSNLEAFIEQINQIGINWIDLNLGCPSKKVVSHHGGAYLLKDVFKLAQILKRIRNNFHKTFTVKMRIGFNDDKNFMKIIKTIQDQGVDAVFIHPRTRQQFYGGKADWKYIEKASKTLNIPVVANGDLMTIEDIMNIYKMTDCHSIMIGRAAVKSPWMALPYKSFLRENKFSYPSLEKEHIKKYIKLLARELNSGSNTQFDPSDRDLQKASDHIRKPSLNFIKSIIHYIFMNEKQHQSVKNKLLRTQELTSFVKILEDI